MKKQKVTASALKGLDGIEVQDAIGKKGFQQYFTPPKLAAWLKDLVTSFERNNRIASVLDLTAGDGALLQPYANIDFPYSFYDQQKGAYETVHFQKFNLHGIELDKENIPPMTHGLGIIHADTNVFIKYLREIGYKADILALNPPFGLDWGGENSALATYKSGLEILNDNGVGYMIMSVGNYEQVRKYDEDMGRNSHIFFKLTVRGAFKPGTDIDTVVAFFYGGGLGDAVNEAILDFEKDEDRIYQMIERQISEDKPYVTFGGYNDSNKSHKETESQLKWEAAVDKYKTDMGERRQKYSIFLQGGKLQAKFTPWEAYTLQGTLRGDEASTFMQMAGVAPSYFGFNSIARKSLFHLLDKGLTIEPQALDLIRKGIEIAEYENLPFYDLKPQQRIGWLDDLTKIKCIKNLTYSGVEFEAGKEYDIFTTSQVLTESYEKEDKDGKFVKTQRVLSIKIFGAVFTETSEHITLLIEHFEVPNPSNIAKKSPELYETIKKILQSRIFEDLTLLEFQIEDIARACMKDSLILAWEQGTGKTRGIIAWAITKAILKDKQLVFQIVSGNGPTLKQLVKHLRFRGLLVVPKNIMLQWENFMRSMNIEVTIIESVDQAVAIKRSQPEGLEFYLVDYNLVKSSKRYKNRAPDRVYEVSEKSVAYCEYLLGDFMTEVDFQHLPWKKQERIRAFIDKRIAQHMPLNNKYICPKCNTHHRDGWVTATKCKKCGYNIWSIKFKGMSYILKNVFDLIAVDEAEKIKNGATLVGKSVGMMRAKYRLTSSGTPIKAYIRDMYSLMKWTLGNGNTRFPYDYKNGGMDKFLSDFGVWEQRQEDRRKGIAKGQPKLLPEISNLALWWKLFFPSAIRRRQEETGEDFVGITFHHVPVPFTQAQYRTYDWWIKNFTQWYRDNRDPNSDDNGRFDMIKGLLWKMRFTATVPDSKQLWNYNGKGSGSNYTMKNFTVLKTAIDLLKQGRNIVIFSALKDECKFINDLLNKYGVRSEVLNSDISPQKQGERVAKFQDGDLDVLVCGTDAMKSGHDINRASAAIFCDYVWNASDFRQAAKRIHRKSSQRDVDIYVIYTKASVDEKMKDLVEKKGAMADIAIDGALIGQDEEEISLEKLLNEAIELFNKIQTGELLSEEDVEAKTQSLLTSFDILKSLPRAYKPKSDQGEIFSAQPKSDSTATITSLKQRMEENRKKLSEMRILNAA